MNNRKILSIIYLLFAIIGAILPTLSNIDFFIKYGQTFDIGMFIQLANVNPAAQSISRDLLIGAGSIFVWIVVESRRLEMKNLWIVIFGCFTIAFAFAAPFFLFLRERRLIEIESEPE